MKDFALDDWLVEYDMPQSTSPGDPVGGGPMDASQSNPANMPGPDPNQNMSAPDQNTPGPDPGNAPNVTNMPDVSNDPQQPDMPEEKPNADNFDVWKRNYFKESIKGDANDLLGFMSPVREQENLKPYQRKFVEDNWHIQLVRLNSTVQDAGKDIKRAINKQLDKNNPATSIINHCTNTLESYPELNNIFIKLSGYAAYKGELHRKFLAALLGAVQVSSSHEEENIILNNTEYSIKIATRLNSDWGEVPLGSWSLKEDDPQKYLSEPELKRLTDGSPEEKEVLTHRVIIESIADRFEQIAFVMHVVQDDGTLNALGWDLSNSIRGAYTEGKLIVKTKHSDESEAIVDIYGKIIPLMNLSIFFAKETGEQDEDGNPKKENIEFMAVRGGMLWLTAGANTMKSATSALQGVSFKETPYAGNPSDLKTLRRCVVSVHDMIMKQC